jgi:DNA-binding HxlR family transcriptional regulator
MATAEGATAGGPMSALEWSTDNCTIARTLAVLGEKWTIQVMREVFVGVRRFEDMQDRTQIPRQVLSNRLAALVDRGLLRREPYRIPGQRQRRECRLTPAGLDLYPVLTALIAWGDQHLAVPEGPPLRTEHRDCGRGIHLETRCEAGHPVPPRQAAIRPGPGARRRPA